MRLEKIVDLKNPDALKASYAVQGFSNEFKKLTNNEERYLDKLYRNLLFLERNPVCFTEHQNFEPIEKDIYCIRHPKSKLNERILFTMGENNEIIILLISFKEKSKSDYDGPLEKARSLLKILNSEG